MPPVRFPAPVDNPGMATDAPTDATDPPPSAAVLLALAYAEAGVPLPEDDQLQAEIAELDAATDDGGEDTALAETAPDDELVDLDAEDARP